VNTDKTERTWSNAPYNWTAIIMFIVTSIPVLTILPGMDSPMVLVQKLGLHFSSFMCFAALVSQ